MNNEIEAKYIFGTKYLAGSAGLKYPAVPLAVSITAGMERAICRACAEFELKPRDIARIYSAIVREALLRESVAAS